MPEYTVNLPDGSSYTVKSQTDLDENQLAGIVADAQKAPTAAPLPKGKQYPYYQDLSNFAQQRGFTVTGANETSGHNVNSPHYEGRAVDIRVRDKTEQQIKELMSAAQQAGITVRDERSQPAGQPVWSGPHIHLEVPRAWSGIPSIMGIPGQPKAITREEYNAQQQRTLQQQVSQKPAPPTDFQRVLGENNPFQAPKPPSLPDPSSFKIQPLEQALSQPKSDWQHWTEQTDPRPRTEQMVNPTPSEVQVNYQRALQTPGTTANAVARINKVFGNSITDKQKQIVSDFIDGLSQSNSHGVTDDMVHTTIKLASEGKWNWMRPPDEVVKELNFSLGDLRLGLLNQQRGIGDGTIPTRQWQGDTVGLDENVPAHGPRIDVNAAKRIAAKKFNISPDDPQFTKMLVAFAKSSGDTGSSDVPQLSNTLKLFDEATPNSGLGQYFSSIPNALRLLPATLQDSAGMAMGMHEGEVLGLPEVQGSPSAKIGSTVLQIGKYFTPAAPYIIGGDVMGMIGDSIEHGPVKGFQNTVNGILQSANFTDPEIDGYERFGRFINALMLGYGIKHGYNKAGEFFDNVKASGELAGKLDISKPAAYRLLLDAQAHAKQTIAQQAGDQPQTAPNPVGAPGPNETQVGQTPPPVPAPVENRPAGATSPVADLTNKYQEQFGLNEDQAKAAATLADTKAESWSKQTGQPKEQWYQTKLDDLAYNGENNGKQENAVDGAVREVPSDGPLSRERGRFIEGLNRTANEHLFGAAVEVKSPNFYYNPETRIWLSQDGLAGAAVSKEGDLVSVFKHPQSTESISSVLALASPHAKTLDAFDVNGFLPSLYAKFGFKPAARLAFDPAQAPANWNPALGEPDVVLMVRDANGKLKLPDLTTEKWETAKGKVPLYSDYDQAIAERDRHLSKLDKASSRKSAGAQKPAGDINSAIRELNKPLSTQGQPALPFEDGLTPFKRPPEPEGLIKPIIVNGQIFRVKLDTSQLEKWNTEQQKYEALRTDMHQAWKDGKIDIHDRSLLDKKLVTDLHNEQRKIAGYYTSEEAQTLHDQTNKIGAGDKVSFEQNGQTMNGTVSREPFGLDSSRVKVKTESGKTFTLSIDKLSKEVTEPNIKQAELISHEGPYNKQETTHIGTPVQGDFYDPSQAKTLHGADTEAQHPSKFYFEGADRQAPATPETPKMPGPKQGWRAGWKTGQIQFASYIQRDLYNLGAKIKYAGRGGPDKTWQRPIGNKDELFDKVMDQLGVDRPTATRLALDTHSDVLEQMKKFQDGEERTVKDNISKPELKAPVTEKAAPKPRAAKTDNKLFTDDAKAAALARIKARKGNMNFFGDPTAFADWLIIAGHYVESGVRGFAAFSKNMIDDIGEEVKGHLPTLYNQAHEQLGLKPPDQVEPKVSPGYRKTKTADFNPTGVIGKEVVSKMIDEAGKTVYVNQNGKTFEPLAKNPLIPVETKFTPEQGQLAQQYASLNDDITKAYASKDVDLAESLERKRKQIELKLFDEVKKNLPGASIGIQAKMVDHYLLMATKNPEAVIQLIKDKNGGYLTPAKEKTLQQVAQKRADLETETLNSTTAAINEDLTTGKIKNDAELQLRLQAASVAAEVKIKPYTDQLLRAMIDADKDSKTQTLVSMFKAFLISTVRNPIMNAKANILDSIGLTLSRIPRGLVDAGLGLMTKQRTREINIQSPLKGISSMVSKEVGQLMKASVTGKLTDIDIAKLDLHGRSRSQLFDKMLGEANKVDKGIDTVINTAFGLVQAWDKPFIELAFRRSIEEQARLVARRAEKLSGTAADKRIQELIKDPTEAMKVQAYADAEYTTLANKNAIADAIQAGKLKLAKSDSLTGHTAHVASEFLMPFAKIPLNAASRGVTFAGGGIISGGFKLLNYGFKTVGELRSSTHLTFGEAVKKAFEDMPRDVQRHIVDNVGNGITGLGIMYVGAMLYQKGLIRPYRPNTPEQRNRNEALGQHDGSINLLGHDVDISDSFVGRMLSAGATMQAYSDGEFVNADGEKDLEKSFASGLGGITKNPLSDTTMTVDQFLENPIQAGSQWLKNQAGTILSPGIVAELAKIGANTNPVVEKGLPGVGDIVKSRLPGVRGTMQAKTDAFGHVTERNWGEYVTNSLDNIDNPVAKEMDRLHLPISKPQQAKKNTDKYGGDTGKDERFDRNQADYQDRVAYVGLKVMQAVEPIIKDPEYGNYDDKNKKAMLQDVLRGTKTGANQELDSMRMTQGYDKTHKYIQDLIAGKAQLQ